MNASSAKRWKAWTTGAGLKSFVSPDSTIELRPSGVFEILFDMSMPDMNRIAFRNIGYGTGVRWQEAREYFVRAWGEVVLPRFGYFMEKGGFSWTDMPDFST